MSVSESGVDQLIDRVKKEAISKAKIEADDILNKAEAHAKTILNAAQANVDRMMRDAQADIDAKRAVMASELQLAARDFTLELANRLKHQMFFPIIKEQVRATLTDAGFLQETLKRLICEYVTIGPKNLDVLVKKELKTTLAAYFASATFDGLEKNGDLRLVDEEGIEGFVLIKRGEHYLWDFRVDTIAHELMRLVEPSLRKYFVAPKKSAERGEQLAV